MPKGCYERKNRPKSEQQERLPEPPRTCKRVTVELFTGLTERLVKGAVVEFVSTNKKPVEVLNDAGAVVKRLTGTDREGRYDSREFYFDAPQGYSVRGATFDKAVITYKLAASEEQQ